MLRAGAFSAGRFVRAVTPCLLAAFLSCKNDLDRVAAIEVASASPDRITHNAEYFYTDSGHVRNRLRAGRIDEWATGPARRELSDGLELVFFDEEGVQQSVLTARRGRILEKEKRMEVYEQVVFVNVKGERLETEQLTWEQDSGRVFTEKAVRVQRGPDVIHGMGLDAAEDFSHYVIHRITGEVYVQDDTLATDAEGQ
ncbi:MAG: LPS export ABC transporter periplasmic protein LptC [Flavobacteriales bacterium]|nr:LPS export ABC transporter periplasmic protein LptC [Flavobacteriales bacterium]